ncbi:alpha/beta-hydrolase [Aureobasidium pullulans]|uniref:Alpha/beta-hydrolase n=1 Tax=Aureobasidium pullulans TaxID=5580 RepID=A0A4S9VPZ3_AURPU|nr:alpha/beta-hydrolase [Aureobasidium pullulans]
MLATRTFARSRQAFSPFSTRCFSSSPINAKLKLAYDFYEAEKPESKKDPIVFIHGLFGSKKNNLFARDLNRPVYAIDLRNHGESPHDPRHDYTALAEDVEGFLQEHKIERPALIGHSMGAKTVMAVALRGKVSIASLIPVDNAPVDAALKSDFGKYVQGMRKIADANVQKQSEADAILAEFESHVGVRQFLLTNLARGKDGIQKFRIPVKYLANALDNMADFPFKDPEEARWEGPTLFIRGTKSHYVADETLPIIGRFFPRFEIADVDSGHWVISEKPQEFRDAVVEFLQDKE